MTVPSFVNASTGGTDAMGAWSATCHAPSAAGRIIIFQVIQDGTTTGAVTYTGNSNINDLAGSAGWTLVCSEQVCGSPTAALQTIYIGRSTGTSAPTISGGNSTSEDLYWRFYEFSDASTGTTLATVIENSTAGATANGAGTSASVDDTGVTTLGIDRLCLNFVGINDDNAISAFTGATGGSWSLWPPDPYAESSGTDAAIGLQLGVVASLSTPIYNTYSVSYALYGGSGTAEELGQSFTTGGALTVAGVYFTGHKVGSPTDNLVLEIQTNSGGLPSGTVVGSSGTVAGTDITAGSWRLFRASVSASLSASTTYHLVFRRDGARDTSNYYQLRGDGPDSITGGLEYRESGTWASGGASDFEFALATSSDLAGGTINGGAFTQADATDGWGVVGFALIGTTVTAVGIPTLVQARRI